MPAMASLLRMKNNIGGKKLPFPTYHIIFIVLCIVIIVLIFVYLAKFFLGACMNHKTTAFMVERFSSDFESSKKFYADQDNRLISFEETIMRISEKLDNMPDNLNTDEINESYCTVAKQIDEVLNNNYMSNVPDGEYSLSKKDQELRKASRQVSATKYISKLKSEFLENFLLEMEIKKIKLKDKDNINFIECFTDSEDTENVELDEIRNKLKEHIKDVDIKVKDLEDRFNDKFKAGRDDEMKYVLMKLFNDKYIKKMEDANTEAQTQQDKQREEREKRKKEEEERKKNKKEEGFQNQDNVEFKISDLGIRIDKLQKMISDKDSFISFKSIFDQQDTRIKEISKLANDPSEQKKAIQKNIN